VSNRIFDLEPITRQLAASFLAMVEEYELPPVRPTQTVRSFDEQMHDWQKGRRQIPGSDPGLKTSWAVVDPKAIVTKAMPGDSAHNYAAAFDICFIGTNPYPDDDALWEAVGVVGERVGLVWGGRWKTLVDRPHFERPDWKSLRTSAATAESSPGPGPATQGERAGDS